LVLTVVSVACPKSFSLTIESNQTPCDLSEADNTFVGSFSPDPNVIGATSDDLLAAAFGQYEWRYINGAFQSDNNPFPGDYKVLGASYHVYRDGADTGNDLLAADYNGATQLIVETAALGDATVALQYLHQTGDLGVRFLKAPGMPLNFIAGAPNPTWSITRVLKPLFSPSDQLRVTAASWATLSLVLVPLPGAGAGGVLPAYDGTMPVRSITDIANSWQWQTTGGQLFTKALSDAELYHTTWEPLSPTTCAWILGFGYSSGGSWAGIGGGGGTGGGGPHPHGRFFFSPGLFSFSVDGQYADVRVATTAALPANTRLANVLTANVVGFFPVIDGVALVVGDRLLVKDEATGANRGLYTLTNAGSPVDFWRLTRSTDADISAEVTQGVFVKAAQGATLGGTYWRLVTLDPITLNTTALSWLQIPPFVDVEAY
jgi:hypothetical protein